MRSGADRCGDEIVAGGPAEPEASGAGLAVALSVAAADTVDEAPQTRRDLLELVGGLLGGECTRSGRLGSGGHRRDVLRDLRGAAGRVGDVAGDLTGRGGLLLDRRGDRGLQVRDPGDDLLDVRDRLDR